MGIQLGSRWRAKRGMTRWRARERPLLVTHHLPTPAAESVSPKTVMLAFTATDKEPAPPARIASRLGHTWHVEMERP
jgi:hypothetical protein